MDTTRVVEAETGVGSREARERRTLLGVCLAHAVHDGYSDLIYVLLPLWQAQFGLSYAALAVLRCLYYGTMGGLQVPGDRITRRATGRGALVGATAVAAAGFGVMGIPTGLAGGMAALCGGLVLAGIGSSVQHPRASLLIADAFGGASRRPLGTYNFAGDLGKAAFPPMVALLCAVVGWRSTVAAMGLLGLCGAAALRALLPDAGAAAGAAPVRAAAGTGRGFNWLLIVGILDTATRMGFLLFLPFLLREKGGGGSLVGTGFGLLFVGGAFGKAVCGRLGERFGFTAGVIGTEAGTAALIAAVVVLPLAPAIVVLPILGVVLNGTSSMLYGAVPALAPGGDVGRGFAVFYTGVIGAGAVAPIGYGMIGDQLGRMSGIAAAAATALLVIPAVLPMRTARRPRLSAR